MSFRLRSLILTLTVCVLAGTSAAATRTRVYVVLVDGLNASAVAEPLMPTLWSVAHSHDGHATFYSNAHAVMPTVTNPNHAALLTASYPAANGIVGNHMSDPVAAHEPFPSEFARYLQVETFF